VATATETEDARIRRLTDALNAGTLSLTQLQASLDWAYANTPDQRLTTSTTISPELISRWIPDQYRDAYRESVGLPTGGGTSGGGTGGDDFNSSAFAALQTVLDRYGLGGLTDWAEEMIRNGRSVEEILLQLREQPLFKERFKAIDLRREYGLNPISPEDIINYENAARDMMRSSGLPAGFYDQFDDFAQLIGKGVSLQSLQTRIVETWDRVVNAPPEVREAWQALYGMQGDQALAAFMFDPDNSEATLKNMAKTAVAGGAMATFGFGIDVAAAARVAGFDLQDSAVRSGFGRLAQINAVFNETLGEREDLDAMTHGINAIFDAGEGMTDIERRITTRQNEFAGGGGALLTQGGLAGVADD
jgi:hypothetical protein